MSVLRSAAFQPGNWKRPRRACVGGCGGLCAQASTQAAPLFAGMTMETVLVVMLSSPTADEAEPGPR